MSFKTVTSEVGLITDWKEKDQKVYTKILDAMRDVNTDFNWHDYLFEDFKTILGALGFSDIEIKFSGFSSQGDGLSFEAQYKSWKADLNALAEHAPPSAESNAWIWELANTLEATKKAEGRFSFCLARMNMRFFHENSVYLSGETIYRGKNDGIEEPMPLDEAKHLFGECQDAMRAMYQTLEKCYEENTSDTAVEETCTANGWYFDQAGNITTPDEEQAVTRKGFTEYGHLPANAKRLYAAVSSTLFALSQGDIIVGDSAEGYKHDNVLLLEAALSLCDGTPIPAETLKELDQLVKNIEERI